MKYVVVHKEDIGKLMYYNVKINGLEVIPKNKVPNQVIKTNKINLIDKDLQQTYIKERINRKTEKVIKFMIRILNDEDTTPSDTGLVLDELNRLKGIVINKYREYLLESEYKALLTKLILLEEEFKKSYNQKIYNNYVDNYYIEEMSSRGR